MRFLVDTSPASMSALIDSPLVCGQLLTPLTRYHNFGGTYAVDNGAFSGFRASNFRALLERESDRLSECLFVAIPDVVGNARRTLELWKYRERFAAGWPHALVAQDGIEDLDIPWHETSAIFIGGCDPWKDSRSAQDVVKTAVTLGVHVHVGRVNTPRRFELFSGLGADTCDGSGVARYEHMLKVIERHMNAPPQPSLF